VTVVARLGCPLPHKADFMGHLGWWKGLQVVALPEFPVNCQSLGY